MKPEHLIKRPVIAGAIGTAALIATGSITVKSTSCAHEPGNVSEDKPNIIVIMADDLGYGDLGGYFGGRSDTPNLNRLAREGMMFTDFHSSGVWCSPTRASLLTGRYPQRVGLDIDALDVVIEDWDRDYGIAREGLNEITMAHYLKQAGYATAAFGKWHLGFDLSANPVFHGFDEFRGLLAGCGDYFSKIDRFGNRDWWHNDRLEFQEGYVTDVITDNAINFMKENRDNPFFIYVAHLAPHFPWQTSEDGHLETRREGEDFTSNYPGPVSKLSPHPMEKIPEVLQQMIEELDENIGRLIEAIRELDLDENTLVVFTSDNGNYLHYHNIWPEVGCNGPLRGQKAQVWEGGHRIPTIAWWPGRIPALSVSDETAASFDLLPTFLDILGIDAPPEGSPNVLDGISILPVLTREGSLEPRALLWARHQYRVVRKGEWKLVSARGEEPELYNLFFDIAEEKNVADKYPGIARELIEELSIIKKRLEN
jgi:arylsulfatase A